MTENPPSLEEEDPRLFRMGDAWAFATYPVCGAVITDEGAVAIDGPMAPATSLQWRAFIEARAPLKFHVLCEHHEDHCACCSVLGADTLISSEITATELGRCASGSSEGMRETLRGWGRNRYFSEELVEDYEVRTPDMTYTTRLSFTLGGKDFVIVEAPGHTRGSSIVHAVDDRVAFVADAVFPGTCAPPAQSCDPWAWFQTLGMLEALDVDWYVPGHGDPFDRSELDNARAGLHTLVDSVRTWKREGWSRERVMAEGDCFDRTLRKPYRGGEDVPPGLKLIAPKIQAESLGAVYDYLDEHPSGSHRRHMDAEANYNEIFAQCSA
ncbi:MAG: MBL fold metallo-hydrolase [Alphaproteobacteria bacterium]|nr:MBL fold metallo-hydrolase [Alphaproteobacteria bacterium]